MLDIEVQCDHCGRAKALTMPFRLSRGRRQAIALGLDHFKVKGFRVQPDGSHACRWCELRRVLGLNVVAGWWVAAPVAVTGAKYTWVAVVAIVRTLVGALDWATGEVDGD